MRLNIYKTEDPAAAYALYLSGPNGQKGPIRFEIPADAKADSFVDVDVPVNMDDEWSGIILKKIDNTDAPGPWIDTISVVVD